MRVWIIEVKNRAKSGGWWGKPIASHFDPRPHFGPHEKVDIDGVHWYATGDPDIYVTAQLREL